MQTLTTSKRSKKRSTPMKIILTKKNQDEFGQEEEVELEGPQEDNSPWQVQVPRDVTGGHIDVRNLHTLRSFKLNDDNWLKWAKATRLIFEIYQLWEGVVYRPNIEARDYTMKNMSAILVITSGLEDHLLSHVSSMAHASEMWDLLKPIGDIHQLHDLKEQLSNLRLTQFESASKFLGKAKELWDHISHMNETFVTEGDFIQILVGILKKVPGVPNPYSPLIQQIGYKYMEGHQDVYTWKWFLRALLAMGDHSQQRKTDSKQHTWATTILDATTVVQKTTRLHTARNPEEETNQHGKEDHHDAITRTHHTNQSP